MNSTYGSSQAACSTHQAANASSCSRSMVDRSASPSAAWRSRLISSGLPAIADSALYGERSSGWVGTSGSTCQTVQPAAARKSTNR